MKDKRYLYGMLFLGLLLIIQITSCSKGDDPVPPITITPGTPFVTSDISGTWHIFATNGASNNGTAAGTIDQGNLRGTLNVDAAGNITGGSYARSNGGIASITGGLLRIDSAGIISGSAATNVGVNLYIGSGKMDSGKSLLSFVTTTNNGEADFFTATRDGGGPFGPVKLAGSWYIFGASGDNAQMSMTDAGNGLTALISPTGGGFINVDGSGLLTGTGFVTTNLGTSLFLTNSPLEKGKINPTNNLMSFAAGNASGNFDLVTAILAGGTFTPADLAGTWYIFGASSTTGPNRQATLSGTIVLDASGNVTGGSYVRFLPSLAPLASASVQATFTGGTLAIDGAGILSGGTATTSIGDNMNLTTGKMHPAKGIMSFVANTTLGELNFLICIKGS